MRRKVIAGTAGAGLAASIGVAQLARRRQWHGLSDAVLRIALRATWREARATARDAPGRVRAALTPG
jgi:hypothetical protein